MKIWKIKNFETFRTVNTKQYQIRITTLENVMWNEKKEVKIRRWKNLSEELKR